MKNLNAEQQRFYALVSRYPIISSLWNWSEKELNLKAYENAIQSMNGRDFIMARFFAGVWLGINQGLDVLDVATLDAPEREVIVCWLADPFWP
ncbi:hypothetical protein ABNR98_004458 [Salmonella enterica]